jgi:hypothetical protein
MDIGNPDDYVQAQDDCAAGVGPWAEDPPRSDKQ